MCWPVTILIYTQFVPVIRIVDIVINWFYGGTRVRWRIYRAGAHNGGTENSDSLLLRTTGI